MNKLPAPIPTNPGYAYADLVCSGFRRALACPEGGGPIPHAVLCRRAKVTPQQLLDAIGSVHIPVLHTWVRFSYGAGTGVLINSVTTLPPGEAATVSASIAAGVLHLSFGLPQGAAGTNGTNGADGPQGPQGPMGAVTPQNLDDAIVTTARNPNALPPFSGTFSDPPTQAEMEAFAAHVEALRAALVR